MAIIDMGQAEVFEAIPAGNYDASLTDWEYVETPKNNPNGDPYVKMEFTIEDGEFTGRKQWRNFSTAPKSLGYLKKALIVLKADAEEISGSFDPEEILPDLIGNSCRIKVSVEDYEGEATNRLDRVMPAA